jgi:hypothetical protein
MRSCPVIIIIILFVINNLPAQGGQSSLFFDGSNDYVDCGADSSLDLTTSFTLQAWIRGDQANRSYARILDKFNFVARQGYNIVQLNNTGSFMFDFFTTENTKHTGGGSTIVFDNQWHFLTATYDGDTARIYIDGIMESKVAIDKKTIRKCAYTFKIGNGFDGNVWFPYHGYIDEARVWNAALDSNMVRDWMHKNITDTHPRFEDLVGYWKFDEGKGTVTNDASLNDNQGVLVNIDTLNSWSNSSIPLATGITSDLQQVAAIWAGKDSANSSILAIKRIDIKNDACIIFGHEGQDLSWTDTDIPMGLNVQSRLNRVWRVEVFDTISANVIFNISGLDMAISGQLTALTNSTPSMVNADTIHGIFDTSTGTFTVSGTELKDGNYYTLASDLNITGFGTVPAPVIPEKFALHQNSPNPFNPTTSIGYQIVADHFVDLSIYNILGQKIETLVSQRQPAGNYQVNWEANNFAGGIYYYKLDAGEYQKVLKMVLLK